MDKFLFIGGMQKCGTTALAAWLVDEGLAEYLVPGMKEPHLFARADYAGVPAGSGSGLWRLDASMGYAHNPAALARMPKDATKAVLCFRNPWERTWSAYKMNKYEQGRHGEVWRATLLSLYRAEARDAVGRYFDDEVQRLQSGTFLERVRYELDFLYARRTYPFMSILRNGAYRAALGDVLGVFAPGCVTCVDVRRLSDAALRQRFVEQVLEIRQSSGPIRPQLEGLADGDIDEPKPDFTRPEFDGLRSAFAYDLQQFEALFPRYGLGTEFMDFASLRRNIV